MCGRYAASRNPEDLREEVERTGLPVQRLDAATAEALVPSYNVAPQQQVAVLRQERPRTPDDDPAVPAGARAVPAAAETDPVGQANTPVVIRAMRWGLVPSLAKDPSVGNRMINARLETVAEKPSYKRLVAARRCLLPADGWYEWQVVPAERSGTGKKRKQPFLMRPREGEPTPLVALAGLYSWWRDPEFADPDDPAAWLGTVTVITTEAEPGLLAVHDRMPVVVPPEHWAAWLDREVGAEHALRLVADLPEGRFGAVPVSAAVGNVRNDSEALLVRPGPAELQGVLDPMTGELFA